jgi:hypothetical protein
MTLNQFMNRNLKFTDVDETEIDHCLSELNWIILINMVFSKQLQNTVNVNRSRKLPINKTL